MTTARLTLADLDAVTHTARTHARIAHAALEVSVHDDAPALPAGGVDALLSPYSVRQAAEALLDHLYYSMTGNHTGRAADRVIAEAVGTEPPALFASAIRDALATHGHIVERDYRTPQRVMVGMFTAEDAAHIFDVSEAYPTRAALARIGKARRRARV